MVKKVSASKSVSKVRSGVTNLVLQIQKVTKKSRERKIKILAFENEIKQQKEKLSENEKNCIFLRTRWLATKHDLDQSTKFIFDLKKQITDMTSTKADLKKQITDMTSTKADVKLRVQNNVLVDDVLKRNQITVKNAISNARKHKINPHQMQQRTKTLLKRSFHTNDMTNWELVLKLYSCPTKSMCKLIMKK